MTFSDDFVGITDVHTCCSLAANIRACFDADEDGLPVTTSCEDQQNEQNE